MHIKNKIVNIEEKYGCSVGVYAKDNTAQTVLFSHNEKHPLPSASAIKLFFAGAVFEAVQKNRLSLEDMLPVAPSHFVHGASILADLSISDMSIRNLLYLLLAHSDTSAQNTLEQLVPPHVVNEYIQSKGFENTVFVSNHESTETTLSLTTPLDAVSFLNKLWLGELLETETTASMLSFLAQSRFTHFGLRYLPTSFNTKKPLIVERYSKAGKIHTASNDTLLVKTTHGVFSVGVFINNLTVAENYNSVDNTGVLLVAELVRDLFAEWYQRVESNQP